MRRTRKLVLQQEIRVLALRMDYDCDYNRFIKEVGKLVRLARKDCSLNMGYGKVIK